MSIDAAAHLPVFEGECREELDCSQRVGFWLVAKRWLYGESFTFGEPDLNDSPKDCHGANFDQHKVADFALPLLMPVMPFGLAGGSVGKITFCIRWPDFRHRANAQLLIKGIQRNRGRSHTRLRAA